MVKGNGADISIGEPGMRARIHQRRSGANLSRDLETEARLLAQFVGEVKTMSNTMGEFSTFQHYQVGIYLIVSNILYPVTLCSV